MQKRHLAILGSTGSIGTQTLEVVEANPDIFEVEVLTAQNNADLLIEQAAKFRPKVVVISNEDLYDKVFTLTFLFKLNYELRVTHYEYL